MIACVALALCALVSVAVQVMVVTPIGYGAPSGCASLRELVTVTLEQESEATGVPGSTVAVQLGPAVVATFAGAVIDGGFESVTVTCWIAAALLPCPSFAV